MAHTKTLTNLLCCIPTVTKDTEGILSGGFVSMQEIQETKYTNLNCPSKSGSCSASTSEYVDNVNCPKSDTASCFGTSSNSENFNCGYHATLCGHTTEPTTETTSNMSSPSQLFLSQLIF